MIFRAFDAAGLQLRAREYYSVGGGFVVDEEAAGADRIVEDRTELAYPFKTAKQLLALCAEHNLSISQLMLANEAAWRPEAETRAGLLNIWQVMQDCVTAGCRNEGTMPGGLKVRRRAAALHRQLSQNPEASLRDPLTVMDWVNLYALAVNEENASGGRVVTAPTNGAAGIVPAVLHYYRRFVPGANDDGVVRFLLTAAAIGILYKENASISGAEVGCQGEVGVACSMAAGALCEVLGGTIRTGGERCRDRHGAQPGTDLRPGRRAGPGCRASSATPWARSRRSTPRAWPCAAMVSTSSRWIG